MILDREKLLDYFLAQVCRAARSDNATFLHGVLAICLADKVKVLLN